MVNDDSLWNARRNDASALGPKVIALVGSSRIQAGLDLDLISRHHEGSQPIQLGLNGTSSLMVLEHLAADETFVGSVIMEILPGHFFVQDQKEAGIQLMRQRLEGFRNRAYWTGFEATLTAMYQGQFVFGHPDVRPPRVLRLLLTGEEFPPPSYAMDANRWRRTFNGRQSDETRAAKQANQLKHYLKDAMVPDEATVGAQIQRLQRARDTLRSRGGELALVRMPSTGPILDRELTGCPRERCWDPLAESLAVPHIHFADHPVLKTLICHDYSHLDAGDATVFTRHMLESLEAQNFRP